LATPTPACFAGEAEIKLDLSVRAKKENREKTIFAPDDSLDLAAKNDALNNPLRPATRSRMPKVAVLTNRIGSFVGTSGGGSAMREKLCEALRDEGHELRLFAAGLHESADVGITDYSPMLIPSWRTLRAIWDVVRESDLLVVSGSFSPCLPFGVAAARLLGVKTLVIFTTDSDKVVNAYYSGLSRVVWWRMHSWCDRMIAGMATRAYARSEDFMQKLQHLHGIRCMGVMTMDDQYKRFGGHIADPPEVLQHARSILSGGRPDLPLLLYADRWAPEKRIELLAANRPPGMVLAIVNPIKDEAKDDMVSALHDPANGIVCLPTYVDHDQLRVYYKAADVSVSASDFENTGHTAHEALLCGTPVVLQRTGGFVSQVEEGKQGFLVDWTNPDDVQVAIYKALALRHSGVRPRHHPCSYEGTDIVREMFDADVPGVLPRSPSQWGSLLLWAARLPFLLILLSIYVVFPGVWPRSNRHSDYINFWLRNAEDEEGWEDEESKMHEKSSTHFRAKTSHSSAEGEVGCSAAEPRKRSAVPYVLISLVVAFSSILLLGLLFLLIMPDATGLSLREAGGESWPHSGAPHRPAAQQGGNSAGLSCAEGSSSEGDVPCMVRFNHQHPLQQQRHRGDWVGAFIAFSAGVALPLTLLCRCLKRAPLRGKEP